MTLHPAVARQEEKRSEVHHGKHRQGEAGTFDVGPCPHPYQVQQACGCDHHRRLFYQVPQVHGRTHLHTDQHPIKLGNREPQCHDKDRNADDSEVIHELAMQEGGLGVAHAQELGTIYLGKSATEANWLLRPELPGNPHHEGGCEGISIDYV